MKIRERGCCSPPQWRTMGQGHGPSAHSLERAGPSDPPSGGCHRPRTPGSPKLPTVLRAAGRREASERCRLGEGPGGGDWGTQGQGFGDRAGMQGSFSPFNSISLQASRCLWLPTPSTKAGHTEMEKISPCP